MEMTGDDEAARYAYSQGYTRWWRYALAVV
jgi:hypothetical protein